MHISQISWSPDCRFIAAGGAAHNSAQRIVQISPDVFERILSVKDAVRCDKDFWRQREFNLIHINRDGGAGDPIYNKKVSYKASKDNPKATAAAEKLAAGLTGIPVVGT